LTELVGLALSGCPEFVFGEAGWMDFLFLFQDLFFLAAKPWPPGAKRAADRSRAPIKRKVLADDMVFTPLDFILSRFWAAAV
jgi:hypothetical protein